MSMKKSVLFLFLVLSIRSGAQLSNEYPGLVKQADSLYNGKFYKESGEVYLKAFASSGYVGMTNDRYNAACAMALGGMTDSAFFQLDRIATKVKYADYNHLTTDPDLASLHTDARWAKLCALVKENKEKAEANLNKPLVAILDSVYIDDQSGRQQYEGMREKFGNNSKEVKDLWKIINEKDSVNLIKVTKILDQYGWLGPDVVGNEGNSTLFLVIQHSDMKIQEKYLPMMREAVKNHHARASSLALLEDRVALKEGRKQIYGSQIGYGPDEKMFISPLEDPDNVDKRRAEVGLGPLAEYVQHWNIKWDVEEYKRQLPEIEKKQKEISAK